MFLRARDIEAVTAASGIVNGRVVRERFPISGVIRVSGEAAGKSHQVAHSGGKLDALGGSGK